MNKARRVNNCATAIARQYIRDNYNLLRKNAIVDNLLDKTGLKEETIIQIYKEIDLELRIREREKREPKIKYKGREREFFKIDDTRLYKDLLKG